MSLRPAWFALGIATLMTALTAGCSRDGGCDDGCAEGLECVLDRCREPCGLTHGCPGGYVCFEGYCERGDLRPALPGGDSSNPGGDPVGGDLDAGGDTMVVVVCGDGTIQVPEACDGTVFGPVTGCIDLGYTNGTLACLPTCNALDLAGCIGPGGSCGNGRANGQEQCDGSDVGVNTCQSLGYAGGTLACLPNCGFDVSSCAL